MTTSTEQRVHELFVLNVALQLFDGVATYQGLRVGWQEANPILLSVFRQLGVAPTLILFKAKACGLLFLLKCKHAHRIVLPALYFLAAVYTCLSLLPWMTKFAILLFDTLTLS
jgi:hypothetical protein